MVTGTASPDDPDLARYWADRRGKQHNGPLSVLLLAKLKAQRGRCPLCGTMLLHANANHSTRASGNVAARHPNGDQQTQHRRRERR